MEIDPSEEEFEVMMEVDQLTWVERDMVKAGRVKAVRLRRASLQKRMAMRDLKEEGNGKKYPEEIPE